MNKRVYVPTNFAVKEIIGNISEECKNHNLDLISINEKICTEHTLQNRSSLSLISPLAYGLGVRKADFRIIPTYAVGIIGYSGKSSLYFRQGLSTFDKIGVKDKDDYFSVIGKILLHERYDIEAELENTNQVLPDILNNYSACILDGCDDNYHNMDITEDWFETYEIPLPVGIWVVRNQEEPDDVIELTNKFAMDDLPEEFESNHHSDHEREGRIMTRWSSDMHNALEQTLELLYYHRLIPELPAVKIYGRD